MRHGETQGGGVSPEWRAWHGMRWRCLSRANRNWDRYGGRGITVCERWNTFENFLADVGRRPSALHSIDRIDNNRGYEPGNARWATRLEQAANKTQRQSAQLLSHNGRTQNIVEWSQETRIPENTLRARIRRGWDPQRALSTPLNTKHRRKAE